MQLDTRTSRSEQRQEDEYAAEYLEQLRLDRERDDERLARQLQLQLELEERQQRACLHTQDEVRAKPCLQSRLTFSSQSETSFNQKFARDLQEMENSRASLPCNPRLLPVKFPSEISPELANSVQKAFENMVPLHFPENTTIFELDLLHRSLKDVSIRFGCFRTVFSFEFQVDPRLAQEVKDRQLALELSGLGKSAGAAKARAGPVNELLCLARLSNSVLFPSTSRRR